MRSGKQTGNAETSGKTPGARGWNDIPFQREQMIAVAAYFRAEKRGFTPNDELGDWFEAEREINSQLHSFS